MSDDLISRSELKKHKFTTQVGYKTAECSCCGERSRLISHDTGFGYDYEYYPFCHWCGADMRKTDLFNFCPNCGADMREEDSI